MTPERYRRIKQLFQAAAELAPAEREPYLVAETAGDVELRRDVENMLRHAGTGLLERPAWEGLALEQKLERGTQVGPYEILADAGVGGMGRVYRARDTRLGRTVAIKVLSTEFRDRLRLEGRAISSLNHPHVCALYDIGNQDGMAYLVMEWVEGESLAASLARGPLAVEQALQYGAEIASGLAAAHAQGIVHRDLKPANIMITASGTKVLDFGVAQIDSDEATAPGGLAGTVAYMSPSQLNGNPADARTDVFALGLVLSEMVAGTDVPAGLAALIAHCLEQDSARRVQRMEDVQTRLERLRSAPVAKTQMGKWAAAAAVAIVGSLIALRPGPAPQPPQVRFQRPPAPIVESVVRELQPPAPLPAPAPVIPPSLVTLAAYPGTERDPSFSPDGSRIAFSWHSGIHGGYGIYVKPVKTPGEPRQLTDGSAEDWGPAWSPNGRTIAFQRRGKQSGIYIAPSTGGPALLLAPLARQRQMTLPQMSWSPDGKWIAAPDRDANGGTQIYLFPTRSGEKRAVTLNPTGTDHAPAFSPNGKTLAYTSCEGADQPCDVYVVDVGRDLAPIRRRRITNQGNYVRGVAWLPDGRSLVYCAGRSAESAHLWRVAVDPPGLPERIDLAGAPAHHPTISPAGGLLAYTRMDHWNLMMIRNFR